jgi:late competence protein required for DNA uptake (superfamily II DNA/RNA helicase)
MSTHAVTYYEIHCDEPGCDIKTADLGGDFSAWGDAGQADEEWQNSDAQSIYKTDKHYCYRHLRPQCVECDNATDLELDEPDGDLYCPVCLAYERSKNSPEYQFGVQNDNGQVCLKDTRESCEQFIKDRNTPALHLVRFVSKSGDTYFMGRNYLVERVDD